MRGCETAREEPGDSFAVTLKDSLQIPTLVCVHVCLCEMCAEASACHSLEREIELVVNSVSHLVTGTNKPQACDCKPHRPSQQRMWAEVSKGTWQLLYLAWVLVLESMRVQSLRDNNRCPLRPFPWSDNKIHKLRVSVGDCFSFQREQGPSGCNRIPELDDESSLHAACWRLAKSP